MSVEYNLEVLLAFTTHICSLCKLCDARRPVFCISLYKRHTDEFIDFLKYVNVLRFNHKTYDKLRGIYRFDGFTGLFCSSICKNYCHRLRSTYKDINSIVVCYTNFLAQFGAILKVDAKVDIYDKFSGIDVRFIGKKFKLPSEDVTKQLSKGQRKKLLKALKKAKDKIDKVIYKTVSSTDNNKQKPNTVTTLMFYNDDKDWERSIKLYLNDEINNRQQTEAV